MDEKVYRQLAVCWGVTPLFMDYAENTDLMVSKAVEKVKSAGYLADGNVAVITAGMPAGVSGTTNMIKAHVVGEQN